LEFRKQVFSRSATLAHTRFVGFSRTVDDARRVGSVEFAVGDRGEIGRHRGGSRDVEDLGGDRRKGGVKMVGRFDNDELFCDGSMPSWVKPSGEKNCSAV